MTWPFIAINDMHCPTPPDDTTDTVAFPLLRDPAEYVACQWDLTQNDARRAYWLEVFRTHLVTLEQLAKASDEQSDATARAAQMASEFSSYLNRCEAEPNAFTRLDINEICIERERLLRSHGFADPYRDDKARENRAALAVLPTLLAELDALDENERAVRVIEGVFAGNIYDLGAIETMAMFARGSVDFRQVRQKLKPRPWLMDHLDAWLSRWQNGPAHRSAVLFVDNAGSDIVLGMIPLARELVRRGTRVILTANSTPALNDVTYPELVELMQAVGQIDPVIREGDVEIVPSGNGAPLIDLSRVSTELAQAVTRRQVDLVILEGMGRAIESNLDVAMTCDVMNLAMVKDQGVADALEGAMYDLVMRYVQREPAH